MQPRTVDLDGPVHYVDFGGSGPTVVLVHGLGGAHLNWMRVGAALARHARVLALDLVGFGRTPLAGRSARVKDNQALLDRFIQAVSSEPVILVGNSMGGAISLLQAARHPERVAGLVLVDPASPRARDAKMDPTVVKVFSLYALPLVGELFVRSRAARIGPEGMVRMMMALCSKDVARIPEDSIQAHVALTREQYADMPWTHGAFLQAARSLLRLLADKRGYHARARSVTAPTLLLHGAEDRLVPVANARELAALRPDWTYVEMANIGHVPMLEAPEAFTEAVLRWWERSQPQTRAA